VLPVCKFSSCKVESGNAGQNKEKERGEKGHSPSLLSPPLPSASCAISFLIQKKCLSAFQFLSSPQEM